MLAMDFQNVLGTGWGNLGTDIRSITVMQGPDGPVFLVASGPLGGLVSFRTTASGAGQVIDQVYFDCNISAAMS